MARCYANPDRWDSELITLDGAESHHLLHVLRSRPGDPVTVFDGQGRVAEGEVADLSKERATVRISAEESQDRPEPRIVLFQAVAKSGKMDMIVQKAVELGASSIVPVLSRNCVVRLTADQARQRVTRWNAIALNAAKQCRASWLMPVEPVHALDEVAAAIPGFGSFWLCSLERDAAPLHTLLDQADLPRTAGIGVLVGPEGDLSPDETATLRGSGATAVSLGDLTLRTETAALYMLSVLSYVFRKPI